VATTIRAFRAFRGNYLECCSERRSSRSPVGWFRKEGEGCNCPEKLLQEARWGRSTSCFAAGGGSGDGKPEFAEAVVGLDRSDPTKEEGEDEVVAGRRTGDGRTSRCGGRGVVDKQPTNHLDLAELSVACSIRLMVVVLLLRCTTGAQPQSVAIERWDNIGCAFIFYSYCCGKTKPADRNLKSRRGIDRTGHPDHCLFFSRTATAAATRNCRVMSREVSERDQAVRWYLCMKL
jgi:hypothetical protein